MGKLKSKARRLQEMLDDFLCKTGIALTREGTPCVSPTISLPGTFFFPSATMLVFVIHQALGLFFLTSP